MKKHSYVTTIATLSSALECYDFVIYASMIPYLNVNFFSNISPSWRAFSTLMVFAVGYISRPVGGLIFGTLGDKYGRKNTFVFSLSLMAMSTLMIAFLPTVEQVGSLAIVLLVICRYLQGVSQGGEVPGAITFVVEHAHKHNININCSCIYLGLGFGALLSSAVCYILTNCLSEVSMIEKGWRLPFILGGVLAVLSYILRKRTQESPLYESQPKLPASQKPIVYLVKYHWKELIKGFLFVLLPGSMVTFTLTYPSYMSTFTQMSPANIYIIMCFGMLTMALFSPIFGWLSDLIRPENIFKGVRITALLISPFVLNLVSVNKVFSNAVVMILVQLMIAGMLGSFPVLLANLFPAKVRYTGIAVTYNLAFAVSAFFPSIYTAFLSQIPHHYLVGCLFSILGILSLTFEFNKENRPNILFSEKNNLSINNTSLTEGAR